jgi:S-disulfanyl-L-cysteine oxidoreductase SoxD
MRLCVLLLIASASIFAQEQLAVPRSVRDGVYTAEQAGRGEALYRRYCGQCHGPDLLGRSDFPVPPQPPLPGVFIRPGSPPLKGASFVSNWNDMSLGDLFERDRISMPQDAPGRLSRQQNADLLAYILQENGYPAGDHDLPITREMLDPIRVRK